MNANSSSIRCAKSAFVAMNALCALALAACGDTRPQKPKTVTTRFDLVSVAAAQTADRVVSPATQKIVNATGGR